MNIERSFKYMFEDEDWLQKLLIGGLVSIVPIVNFAAIGWGIRAFKNITEGQETPLPDWSNFGEYFVKGLMTFLAALVYSLPIIILSCLAGLIDGAVARNSYESTGIFSLCTGLVSTLYGLVIGVLLPAGLTKYVVTDEFASFFRFGEMFSYIKDNLSNYAIAVIISAIAGILASLVGGLVCVVGIILTAPWATLVTSHLFAQVYNESNKPAVA